MKRLLLSFAIIVLLIAALPTLAQEATATPEPPDCPVFEGDSAEVRTSYYMGEGIGYFTSSQFGAANRSFTCVIAVVDPGYVPAYMMRAATYVQQRDYERAIEDYSEAIERQPDLLAAYNNRGIVYAATLDYEKAAADFDRVLEISEDSILGHNNRSVIYAIEGDYEQAIAMLQRAIDISGIDDIYDTLTDPDRPSDAQRPEYDPLNARAYALLGIVYSAQSLDNYQKYIFLTGGGDGRIQAAAGALESRFTFETRLDDGTWLLTASFSPTGQE